MSSAMPWSLILRHWRSRQKTAAPARSVAHRKARRLEHHRRQATAANRLEQLCRRRSWVHPQQNPFDRPLPTTRDDFPSGSAWASVGVSNIGSVDARIDASNEQGKFGTTLKQSIPFGGRFAITLQDTYSVTDTRGQQTAGPSDIPLNGFATRFWAPDAAGVRQ